jgi:hypothetical protein
MSYIFYILRKLSTSNIEKSFLTTCDLNTNTQIDSDCSEIINKLFTNKFDNILINIKLIFLILFIIASVLVADTDYIKKNPGNFTAETVIYAFFVALAFVYMQGMRYVKGDNNKYSRLYLMGIWFVIVFFGMIVINILLQLSGFYTLLFDPATSSPNIITNYEKKIKSLNESFYITIIGILLYTVCYLLFFAILVGDFTITNYGKGGKFIGLFLLEIIIFGALNALPFIYIYVNRAPSHSKTKTNHSSSEIHVDEHDSILTKIDHSKKETIGLFIKMVVLHLLLQAGGFYKHTMGFE